MEEKNIRKVGIGAGLVIVVIVSLLVLSNSNIVPVNIVEPVDEDKPLEWHVVYVWSPDALGDNSPGAGAGGWIEFFLLDYAQVPETVLANNATDWSASANAMGHTDADDWDIDIVSEDPFYFVCGARFNASQCQDAGVWNESRWRIRLTVSGDETINQVYEYNNSGSSGDGVTSSKNGYLYVYAWWDDGVDGYQILDDGSLTVSEVRIEAQY